MHLTVKPYHKNIYPRGGILIRGSHVAGWLQQVQLFGLPLEEMDVYAIPGGTAGSVWGCLLIPRTERPWPADIGSNVYCQNLQGKLFLPENSRLYPQLSAAELDKLLKERLHLFHPETGWIELSEPIRWEDLLTPPVLSHRRITTPADPVFIPSRALAFYKQSLPQEEVLENMDVELFPTKSPNTRPLSFGEKIKLRLLRLLLGRRKPEEQGRVGRWIDRLASKIQGKWINRMQASLEELEERNNREVDKLLDLFKKDPMEALKYAIPIDSEGSSRGSEAGTYQLSRLWASLSLLGGLMDGIGGGRGGSGYGGSVRLGNKQVSLLNQEYRNTAQALLQNREYRQAAFVYLRLLRDYYAGADALEKGGYYSEAASIHLKYTKDKVRAAECYEKGKMPLEAIELYKELGRDEKVGDLYLSIGKRKDALPWFEKVIGLYTDNQQYVKAAAILRDKLDEPAEAQAVLLKGWTTDKDAVNCLSWYFSIIDNSRQLEQEIQVLYERETNEKNREKYLQVLKNQYERYAEIQDTIRDIAYAIVADRIADNPLIASELQGFNKKDKRLLKDILLYRQRIK